MKNKYEVRGDVTAIFLNRRDGTTMETLIDTADLERADDYQGKWFAHKGNKTYYVMGNVLNENGAHSSIQLHRHLCRVKDDRLIDHINNDTLDNRRSCNLREVNRSQNGQNIASVRSDNKTGINGVSWVKRLNKFVAQVCVDGKNNHIGCYDNAFDAEKAVNTARSRLMPYSKQAMNKIMS